MRVFGNHGWTFRAVGSSSKITEVHQGVSRAVLFNGAGNGHAADAGVEDANHNTILSVINEVQEARRTDTEVSVNVMRKGCTHKADILCVVEVAAKFQEYLLRRRETGTPPPGIYRLILLTGTGLFFLALGSHFNSLAQIVR
jgi:hypothetical protein